MDELIKKYEKAEAEAEAAKKEKEKEKQQKPWALSKDHSRLVSDHHFTTFHYWVWSTVPLYPRDHQATLYGNDQLVVNQINCNLGNKYVTEVR